MLSLHRTALRRRVPVSRPSHVISLNRGFRVVQQRFKDAPPAGDPRVSPAGDVIEDEFAKLREDYQAPKHPIVLAHGLFGFDEIHPMGRMLPGVQYWSGIEEALATKGIEVITATVPPSGRVEVRAKRLAEDIEAKAKGKAVNIIAGLDARHMISRLQPRSVAVKSLTTIATPHRGSAFADYIFAQIGPTNIPKVYKMMDWFGFDSGAFRQLTQGYMAKKFNPRTPDVEGVRYYSYGASLHPQLTSVFRQSHGIVKEAEGENDGLVSVASSKWGTYQGTLQDVSHLDLINWTNKLRWYLLLSLTGKKRKSVRSNILDVLSLTSSSFNAIAFYLGIADMLAREGL